MEPLRNLHSTDHMTINFGLPFSLFKCKTRVSITSQRSQFIMLGNQFMLTGMARTLSMEWERDETEQIIN